VAHPRPEELNRGIEDPRHEILPADTRNGPVSPLRAGRHTRGYLPRVKRENASYFVTFRLADSLPKAALARLEHQKAQRLQEFRESSRCGESPSKSIEEIARNFQRELERNLDQGAGSCHLRRPQIADLMVQTMRHFDQTRYELREWVVMPNHVHAVLHPLPNHLLGDILKSWKQFTSRRANPILGLEGQRFWQPESYDHWIRDLDEGARIRRYIHHNPVKAHLCANPGDWRWSSAWSRHT
jgi:REP element-mobilizing transposase RayT